MKHLILPLVFFSAIGFGQQISADFVTTYYDFDGGRFTRDHGSFTIEPDNNMSGIDNIIGVDALMPKLLATSRWTFSTKDWVIVTTASGGKKTSKGTVQWPIRIARTYEAGCSTTASMWGPDFQYAGEGVVAGARVVRYQREGESHAYAPDHRCIDLEWLKSNYKHGFPVMYYSMIVTRLNAR